MLLLMTMPDDDVTPFNGSSLRRCDVEFWRRGIFFLFRRRRSRPSRLASSDEADEDFRLCSLPVAKVRFSDPEKNSSLKMVSVRKISRFHL
jgi:hypothetical protein